MTTPRGGPPVDPGLQQQRTILSWDRTGLALVAASLGVGRHALGAAGWVILVPCAMVLLSGVWLLLDSWRRGRLAQRSRREPGFVTLRDGRTMALVAAVMAALCLGEFVASLADALLR